MPHSDPEKRKEYRRQYDLDNREKALAQMAIWRTANPERHAVARCRSKLWLTYKLAPEAYQALHDQQNGTCAICGDCAAKRSLHVDHVKGMVRGLLCNSCNRGMGLLKDDVVGLEAAIVYLKRTAA